MGRRRAPDVRIERDGLDLKVWIGGKRARCCNADTDPIRLVFLVGEYALKIRNPRYSSIGHGDYTENYHTSATSQNKREWKVWRRATKAERKLLVPAIKLGPAGRWILMQRVRIGDGYSSGPGDPINRLERRHGLNDLTSANVAMTNIGLRVIDYGV